LGPEIHVEIALTLRREASYRYHPNMCRIPEALDVGFDWTSLAGRMRDLAHVPKT